MIKLKTSRFGDIEVEQDKIVNFPDGLIGLPDIKEFILIDHKDTPLKWLQAMDDPDIAFIVVPPDEISEGYNVDIDKKVVKIFGSPDSAEVLDKIRKAGYNPKI